MTEHDRARRATVHANLAGLEVGDGFPVRLVGAINVSPESFYKGSVALDELALQRRAEEMAAAGADMLDVGAMSTAPYLDTAIDEGEEIRRLTWALGVLKKTVTIPLSADTKRHRVAQASLDAGAVVINDVSGFRHDPAMAGVARAAAQGVILMASDANPNAADPIRTVCDLLRQTLALADEAGVPHGRIVLDPGIGFFRTAAIAWDAWDCEVLRRLNELRLLGHPILVGLSRKSFIGKVVGKRDPAERLSGSLAATAVAVLNGAHMIRTHDVGPTRDAIRVAEILRAR